MLKVFPLHRSAVGVGLCSLLFLAIGPAIAFVVFHATGQLLGFFDLREVDWSTDWPTFIRILSAFYVAGGPPALVTGLLYGAITVLRPTITATVLGRVVTSALVAVLCITLFLLLTGAGGIPVLLVAGAIAAAGCAQLVRVRGAKEEDAASVA